MSISSRDSSQSGVSPPTPRNLQLTQLMRERRSVRRLKPDPVPDDLIFEILESGRWAPSPHGTQPWRFAVLKDRAVRERLTAAMANTWQHNLAMDGQDPDVVASRLTGSHRRMLEAPVLILISLYTEDLDRYPDSERQESETTMAIQSLGACIQNMLLTTYQVGLDAGWMCAPLFCPEVVRDSLELPTSHVPHALIPIGYVDAEPKRRPRRPLDELITLWA
jgi:coenzyme F420-0:L-glutamate ligase/coenzyme F420-1:gamma-L-glutamate ligase